MDISPIEKHILKHIHIEDVSNSFNSRSSINESNKTHESMIKLFKPNIGMPYIMKKSNWKWVALFLACFVTFGDWYCFDSIAVL